MTQFLRLLTFALLLLSFTASGQTFMWADNGGANFYDYANDTDLDNDGNMVVVGNWYSYNAGFELATASYSGSFNSVMSSYVISVDEDGNDNWAAQIMGNGNGSANYGYALADAVHVSDYDQSVLVSGTYQYGVIFGSSGTTSPTTNAYEGFVVKYDSTGNLDWYKAFKGPGYDHISSVSTDANGDIYVLGRYEDSVAVDSVMLTNTTTDQTRYYVAKFSAGGTLQWLTSIETGDDLAYSYVYFQTYGYRYGKLLNLSSSENEDVIVTGGFTGSVTIDSTTLSSTGSYDMFLARINADDGSLEWLDKAGSTSVDWPNDLAVDANDNIYVTGMGGYTTLGFDSNYITTTGYKGFLAKYNDAGNCTWAIGSNGNTTAYSNNFTSVGLDDEGFAYVGGKFSGTLSLGSLSIIGANTQTSFVAQYDLNTSSWIWVEGPDNSYSSGSNNAMRDLSVRSKNDLFGAGYFRDDVQFGEHQLSNGGNDFYADAYIFRTADCSELVANAYTVGNDSIICQGEDIEVYADTHSLYSYQWLYNGAAITGEINESYTVDDDGAYSVVIDSAGCVDTSNLLNITVAPLPNVSHSAIPGVCDGDEPFQLTGGNPSGGWYNGDAVVGGDTFDPSLATLGNNTVWYIYADANGCSDSVSKNVNVYQTPAIFTTTITACEGDAPISLSGAAYGFPTGGTHSGPGVSGSQFDPGVAGPGAHGIYYTASNGCTADDSIVATVTASPNVNLTVPSSNACATSSTPLVLTGTPSGGTYTWNNINSQLFYPSLAGTGNVMVTYSVTQSGCTAIDTDYIFVDTVPTVNIAAFPTLCEGDDTLGLAPYGTPSGGTFSGTGVSANVFNPVTSGAGTFTITYSYSNGCGSYSDTESITVGETPTLSISSTNVSCNGGSDGSATVSVSGGSAPYSYAWSSGGSAATENSLSAGTYTIVVTDNNGCSDSTTVTINEPSALLVSVNSSAVSCNGGSNGNVSAFPSGGTSPYSYLWSTGATTAIVTGLSAGTYAVTVTDANSCQKIESVVVTEPTPVVASISSSTDVSCNGGSDGSATASGSGGTSPYTYAWTGGGSSATKMGLSAGTHTVTITDANGCSDNTTVTISEPTPLLASISSSTDVSCNGGSDGSATASGSGGTAPYTYAWNGGGSSATKTGLSAGTHTVTITDANGCSDNTTVTITEPATSVTVSITSSTDVTCNGGSDGSATASGSGGTGTITYGWSGGGGSSASATGLSAGTYIVTATDANGCTATDTVTINEPSQLTASISSSTNVSCNGGSNGSATATASGGTSPYTYAWNGGGSSATKTGLSAGTHTVTITDANGCSDSTTVTINEPTSVVASISSSTDVSCNGGSDGSATASGSGGTSPYTYAWTGGGSSATKMGLSAGTHTVTITDANGCSDNTTVTISEPTPLLASISSSTDVSCNGGSDGSATASGSGGTAPYTYAWTGGGSSATKTGLSAGTHTVTITDANGCSDNTTVTITEPATSVTVSITSSTDVTCNGGSDGSATASGSGGTGTITYGWSGGGGSSASATGLSAGTYIVTATDANGCTATDTVTINEPSQLTASISSSTNVSCNGGSNGSATATASGGTSPYTYAWNGGGSSATKTGLSAGTHTVTITDANGCSDSTTVTITEPTSVVASISSSTDVSCNGGSDGSATASGSGGTSPYTYAWSTGATTASASGLAAATYTVVITDANGCQDSTQVIITEPSPTTASITSSTDVSCNGGSDGSATAMGAGGTPPYTYNWSSGSNSATATGLAAGTFTVTVTDTNGCTQTASVVIGQPSALSSSIVVDNDVSCNGGMDGAATVTITGGTPTYAYNWSNGENTASADSLMAGTSYVTVTDANGCVIVDSVSISEPSSLTASASVVTNVSCFGGSDGSASASASGGTSPYSYAWSAGGSTSTIAGLSAGAVTVTITDANGCVDSASVTITEPMAISLTASGTNISCNGANDGSISTTVSGGTLGYTYLWSTGATSSSISGLSSGTYTVQVSDANGCTVSDTATVIEPAALASSATLINDVSCFGGSNGSIAAGASGGTSPYTYSWNNGATSDTLTGLSVGTYTVVITDFNGCVDSSNVTVAQPTQLVASAMVDSNTTCASSATGVATASATGGVSPYTYLWSTGSTTTTASGLSTGTYCVTVSDANGCADTACVSIVVEDTIAPMVMTQNITAYLDATGQVTITSLDIDNGSSDACGIAYRMLSDSIFNCADSGNNTVTLYVEDVNGNMDSATAVVTVVDTIAPSLSVASTTTLYLDANGVATVTPATVDSASFDNCAIASLSIGQDTFTCADLGDNLITFQAVDVSGNVATTSALIQVIDTIAPMVFTQDIIVYLDATGAVSITPSMVDSASTDACGIDSTALSQTSFDCSDIGANAVVFTAVDGSGNIGTGSATVTVLDTVAPAALAYSALSLYLDASGQASLTPSMVDSMSSDACGIDTMYIDQDAFDCADASTTTTVTLTVVDVSGNSSTASTQVSVWDTLAPIPVVTDTTLYVDANGVASLNAMDVDNGTSDNCAIDSIYLSQNTFDCDDIGAVMTITFFAVDDFGNIGQTDLNVTILDSLAPQVSTQNITVYLDSSGMASIDTTSVNNNSFDNCAIDSLWLSNYDFSCADTTAPQTVWMYGVDESGNVDSASAFVTVLDTIAPVLSVADTTIYLDSTGNVTLSAWVVGQSSFDNCAIASQWLSDSTFSCADTLANVITYYAQDVSGNVDSMTFVVNVYDTTSPEVVLVNAAQFYLPASGSLTITAAMLDSASSDNCAIDSMALSQYVFDCSDVGLNIVSVTATDVSGNQSTMNTFVYVWDTLTNMVVTMDSAILCAGGNGGVATASATGLSSGYTYLWSDGQTTATATGLSAGTYSVTATSAGGCEVVDSVTFVDPAGMSGTLSAQDITCFGGNDGFVTASISGGTPGYTYMWSNGGITDSIGGLSAGTYTLTVTDTNGCAMVMDTTLVAPSQLAVAIQSSVTALCEGDSSAQLTANVSGGTPSYDLLWDVGYVTSQDTVSNLPAGTYYLAVTDSVGCAAIDSITIIENPLPSVTIDIVEDTVCAGTVVSLSNVSPVGGTYTGAGVLGDSLLTDSLLGDQWITYSFTDVNGCTSSATDSLHVLPQAQISFLSNPVELCQGQAMTLDFAAPVGGIYNSPFIQDSMLVAPDSIYNGVGGVYAFTNACGTDTASFDLVVFPLPEVDLGNDTMLCNADQLKLDAGAHSSYLWSTGATSQSILINNGEEPIVGQVTAWVEVSNAEGCVSSDTITIMVEDQPIFYLGDNIEACLDSVITLSVPNVYDNFLWSDSSTGTSIVAHDGSVKMPGPYPFWVVGMNASGCSYSDTIYIRLIDCDSVFVGVEALENDFSFEFYPNPAQTMVNLVLDDQVTGLKEVTIYGAMGELVRTYGQADWKSIGRQGEVNLELGELPNGVYLLQVTHESGTLTRRMIVGR